MLKLKTPNKLLLLFVVIVGMVIINESIYNVRIDQYALITQKGKVVSRKSGESGLSLKLPFIQKVHYLPRAVVYEWNNNALIAQTNKGISILIDTFMLWTIEDPEKFYNFFEDNVKINSKLKEMIVEKYRTLYEKDIAMINANGFANQRGISGNRYLEKEIKTMLLHVGIKALDLKIKVRKNDGGL